MRKVTAYFRANPQVFVLLLICVILGLGTFIAVLIALASSGSGTTSGEPSGSLGLHLVTLRSALSALPGAPG